MLVPHLSVQAKAKGYNGECRSSSQWKQVKSLSFSVQGRSYTLIELNKANPANLKLGSASFCLVQGGSPKPLKIFQTHMGVELTEEGGIYNFKKLSGGVFTVQFTYDTNSTTNFKRYQIDVSNPSNTKITLLKAGYR
jgi:hypothetical protein